MRSDNDEPGELDDEVKVADPPDSPDEDPGELELVELREGQREREADDERPG